MGRNHIEDSHLGRAAWPQRMGAEVVVLEARERAGGRIHSWEMKGMFAEGGGMGTLKVDLGASFICGTSREAPCNPIMEYVVDKLGIPIRPKASGASSVGSTWRSFCVQKDEVAGNS